MSTGYGWEGIRQVCATLLGARHVGLGVKYIKYNDIWRLIPSGVVAMGVAPPRYFQHQKIVCKKHFALVLE